MAIVGAFDVHRRQVTFDVLDTVSGQVRRGQVRPAGRATLRQVLGPVAGQGEGSVAGGGPRGVVAGGARPLVPPGCAVLRKPAPPPRAWPASTRAPWANEPTARSPLVSRWLPTPRPWPPTGGCSAPNPGTTPPPATLT